MSEDFEGKGVEYPLRRTVLLRKDQIERIKELVKDKKIERFNLSMFVRKHLDDYLAKKEKRDVK
jgi:hypothetical protein